MPDKITITPDVVEKVAKAIYGSLVGTAIGWKNHGDEFKDVYRGAAICALKKIGF